MVRSARGKTIPVSILVGRPHSRESFRGAGPASLWGEIPAGRRSTAGTRAQKLIDRAGWAHRYHKPLLRTGSPEGLVAIDVLPDQRSAQHQCVFGILIAVHFPVRTFQTQ